MKRKIAQRKRVHFDQSGVIPYRKKDGKTEVLLVTSIRKKNWIVPKGFIEYHMSPSKQPLAYPLVRVSGLDPGTRYRWIARERVQPFTEFSGHGDGEAGRCEPGALRGSTWAWHHVPFNFSFRTP